MIPLKDLIVKVESAYNTSITLKGGAMVFLDPNLCQVKDTIRHGDVVAVPEGLDEDIRVGDKIFFHHNIVAVTRLETGDIESAYLINRKDKLYRIPVDKSWPMYYAVLRDGEFKCLPNVCFVRPVKTQKYNTMLFIPDNEKEERHIGEVVHLSDTLKSKGIVEGDRVVFSKDSEYQFQVNGEQLYCMFDRWILGKHEG